MSQTQRPTQCLSVSEESKNDEVLVSEEELEVDESASAAEQSRFVMFLKLSVTRVTKKLIQFGCRPVSDSARVPRQKIHSRNRFPCCHLNGRQPNYIRFFVPRGCL